MLVLALGVVVALARHGGLLHFGTGSLEARTDYWRGAIRIIKDHPWIGTGPGTFGSIYPMYKTALTEEAAAVHNSFLQMWSDSGILAFLAFGVLWIVAVRDSFRLSRERVGDVAAAAICGALVGWTVHGLVDFELYVPGVALPAFVLLGTLQGLKELPQTDTVPPRRRENWLVAGVCVVLVAAVLWIECRALAAAFMAKQAHRIEGHQSVSGSRRKQAGGAFGALEFAPSIVFGGNGSPSWQILRKHSRRIAMPLRATRTGLLAGGNWRERKWPRMVLIQKSFNFSREPSS